MGTDAPIPMNTWQPPMIPIRLMTPNRALLTLAQWLSPAYPVGGFAYSHGLESAIHARMILTPDDLLDWLSDLIVHGSGRNDCVLLQAAHASKDVAALDWVNDTGLAFAASSERQLETTLQGQAFCKTTAAIWDSDGSSYIYPVAVGAASARLSIDATVTATMYVHAIISNLVAAAQRLMKLGQTDGQAIIAALAPLCETVAKDTATATLDDLHATTFLFDIASMQHETLQPRIFRS